MKPISDSGKRLFNSLIDRIGTFLQFIPIVIANSWPNGRLQWFAYKRVPSHSLYAYITSMNMKQIWPIITSASQNRSINTYMRSKHRSIEKYLDPDCSSNKYILSERMSDKRILINDGVFFYYRILVSGGQLKINMTFGMTLRLCSLQKRNSGTTYICQEPRSLSQRDQFTLHDTFSVLLSSGNRVHFWLIELRARWFFFCFDLNRIKNPNFHFNSQF